MCNVKCSRSPELSVSVFLIIIMNERSSRLKCLHCKLTFFLWPRSKKKRMRNENIRKHVWTNIRISNQMENQRNNLLSSQNKSILWRNDDKILNRMKSSVKKRTTANEKSWNSAKEAYLQWDQRCKFKLLNWMKRLI